MSWSAYDGGASAYEGGASAYDGGAGAFDGEEFEPPLDPASGGELFDPTDLMGTPDPMEWTDFLNPHDGAEIDHGDAPALAGVTDLPNHNPAHSDPHAVVGDPGGAMGVWHQHTGEGGCAIGAQGMVLEYLTGERVSEEQLTAEAADRGWCDGGGTSPDAVGNLLELHGVRVEHTEGASLAQLQEVLSRGDAAIVGLDADEIWAPGHDLADDTLGDLPGIPGQDANHAVWVTGFDHSDPAHPMVVLNDSGHPDGQGLMVPLDEFLAAWQDSGNLLVTAERPEA
ncbi:C39 family peptidase [Streptomyces syringium]|uniref:C39 family peptidase n=1 Tax=Streptomyces syringium TaxID=76729 RepID=UPI00368935A8